MIVLGFQDFILILYKKSPRGLARLLLVVRGKLRPCGSEMTPNGALWDAKHHYRMRFGGSEKVHKTNGGWGGLGGAGGVGAELKY